jgi:enhancing lycopene biosynthesis protein 2
MPKRVGVVLSGCGPGDGSEIREAVLTMLSIERGGGEVLCMAPDRPMPFVMDHLTGDTDKTPRSVLAEAARIARGQIQNLAAVKLEDVDALVFPGGQGVATVLSNYVDKGAVCDVHPDVVRLMKAHLSSHRPMGFVCLAPILAARVLGPIAGVRITLGHRGTPPAKHAAVMGADVRPCPVREIMVDQKSRVLSTPAYMYDEASVTDVAVGIDKMVRALLGLAKDRRPRPPQPQVPPQAGAENARPTRGPGSV